MFFEGDAAIHHQPLPGMAVQVQVHTYLAATAQRKEPEIFVAWLHDQNTAVQSEWTTRPGAAGLESKLVVDLGFNFLLACAGQDARQGIVTFMACVFVDLVLYAVHW